MHAGSGVCQGTRVVTVMINGVSRSGVVNEQGEIVVTSESPKFFEIKDDEGDRDGSRCEPSQEARASRGNPFSAHALSPFRGTGTERVASESLPTSTTSSSV